MNAFAILLVPACGKGSGGGHFSRSMYLLRKLAESGREVYLWISEGQKKDAFLRFGKLLDAKHENVISQKDELLKHTWDFILLDNFRTLPEDFAFWASFRVPLIGMDEGGPCRNRFDFLIDLLPSLSKYEANICAPELLPMPKNRRPLQNDLPAAPKRSLKILISFGAEDSSGLGLSAARSLVSDCASVGSPSSPEPLCEITLVTPNCKGIDETGLSGVRIIEILPNLKEHLAEYDLFITHFGIGAFEAVYARVPVLLLSPTPYHEKLAKKSGFITIDVKDLAPRRQDAGDAELLSVSLRSLRVLCELIAECYGLAEDQK